jgi:hypothetical protein
LSKSSNKQRLGMLLVQEPNTLISLIPKNLTNS